MGYKLLCFLTILTLSTSPATAQMTQKDIIVIARTIQLIENAPMGNVKLAVIKGKAPQADAESFIHLVNSGKSIGKITLNAVYISASDIEASGSEAIFIPPGIDQASMEAAFKVAKEQKLLILTTAEDCLNQRKCAIYFKSSPAVEIRMSEFAAKETGVQLGSAFQMMIKQVP